MTKTASEISSSQAERMRLDRAGVCIHHDGFGFRFFIVHKGYRTWPTTCKHYLPLFVCNSPWQTAPNRRSDQLANDPFELNPGFYPDDIRRKPTNYRVIGML